MHTSDGAAIQASAAGTFALGGVTPVARIGYDAVRITAPGIIDEPADMYEARRVLRRAGLLTDARVTIYPDAAHGFLFQHHSRFAADVNAFLADGG